MSAHGRRADGGRPGWTPAPVPGQGGGMTDERQRTPVQALFWRVIVINGLVFTVGDARAGALARDGVLAGAAHRGARCWSIGLAVMLAANALLLRGEPGAAGRAHRAHASGSTCCAPATGCPTGQRRPHRPDRRVQRDARPAGGRADREQRARAGRAGGRAAAHRPGAARRDRAEPDRGAARPQAGRRPGARPSCATSCARCRRRSAPAWTRSGRSPGGCGPGVLEDLGLHSALNALAAEFAAVSGVHGRPAPRTRAAGAEQRGRAGALPRRPGEPDQHRPARRTPPASS